ncbi:hypothetical protein Zm00014a_017990, partial [Zea mays]
RAPPPQIPAVPSSFPGRRWSSAVSVATVSFAPASATRDAPQFPLPLPISLCPRSPVVPRAAAEVRHRRPGPPSRHCRRRGVPGARLEVKNLSRPYRPVYCLLSRLIPRRSCSTPPLSRFTVDRPPPVPLSRPSPTGRFPVPSPTFPAAQVAQRPAKRPRPSSPASPPPRGRAPPPQLAVGEAQAGHPIPIVRPRSGGPVLIRSSLILAVRRRSSGPGPLSPHPVSLPFGPRLSARPRARSARRPRLSAARALALPAGPACQPARALALPAGPACQPARALRCPPGPACQPPRPPRARAPARRI